MENRVLVCDDQPGILSILQLMLSNAGYKVHTAIDGEVALEIAQEVEPDVIITDCMMPRLDGLQLCDRLSEHEATRHIPVILLTARAHDVEPAEIHRRSGIRAVVSKPFSPRGLVELVENMLMTEAPLAS